jgi:hypothetical protein
MTGRFMCYVLDIQIYAFKQRVCRPQTVSQLPWHGDVGPCPTFDMGTDRHPVGRFSLLRHVFEAAGLSPAKSRPMVMTAAGHSNAIVRVFKSIRT